MTAAKERGITGFDGAVAVVTGAASGIGRATSLLLSGLGANIVAIDVDTDGLDRLGAELDDSDCHQTYVADVGDPAAIGAVADAVLARRSEVHVLFNNAGIGLYAPLEMTTFVQWQRLIDVNLSGAFNCTMAFLPGLKMAAGATVINNSSIDGLLGNPYVAAFSASKGGLTPLTHVMAYEFARYNIRVNCIATGGIESNMLGLPFPPEQRARLEAATPLKRLGTPDEVAQIVAFLASPASSYVSGAVIPVEGGRIALTPGWV